MRTLSQNKQVNTNVLFWVGPPRPWTNYASALNIFLVTQCNHTLISVTDSFQDLFRHLSADVHAPFTEWRIHIQSAHIFPYMLNCLSIMTCKIHANVYKGNKYCLRINCLSKYIVFSMTVFFFFQIIVAWAWWYLCVETVDRVDYLFNLNPLCPLTIAIFFSVRVSCSPG